MIKRLVTLSIIIFMAQIISACSTSTEPPAVFIKADPPVDAVLDRAPRTLRVYLTALPDISESSLQLFGDQGEISLSRFHTMGADDLMIEIDDRPLPNGTYTVEWTAIVEGDSEKYSGKYQFTVAVEE